MTSFNVDKMLGQEPTVQKPNPILTFLLGIYFCFMGLMLLGGMSMTSRQVPGLLVFLLVGACIGLPLYFRDRLKIQWRKRHITALSMLGALILLMVLGACTTSSSSASDSPVASSTSEVSEPEPESAPSNQYALGDQFQVGYTQYRILNKKWQKQLGNEYFGSTADARYLLVRIQVKNMDKEERMVPQFTLVDENGSEYKESSDSMYLGKEAPILKSLNPSVQTKLTALFDVPPEHHYTLKLSGGYWSSDEAFVKLN